MKTIIRPLERSDWAQVLKIYEEGIDSKIATFESHPPDWEEWDRSHLKHSRWVATSDDRVLGWAALSPVSDRCVYGGVAEVSVYVSRSAHRLGIGKKLLQQMITSSEENGIWTLTAGMFPENEGSIALHLACGFRKIGVREKIGKLDGEWKDTFLFERRSSVIV